MKTMQEKSFEISKARKALNDLKHSDNCIYNASIRLRDCVNHALRGTKNAAFGYKFYDLYNPRGFHLKNENQQVFEVLEKMIYDENENLELYIKI